MQNECYTFKKYIYNNYIFKNTIDATYIINLENNKRLDHIMNQLSKYHPTKIIYICFNKGYKKCKKQSFINNPPSDLVDAFINVFKHAKSMNYNNILVLEDDFIFNKEIKNQEHINNINNFLINHNNKLFQYYLGCVPFLLIPYNYNNYRNISLGTHSVIYSKKLRNKILKINQKNICDWDYFNAIYFIKNRYCYYKPLCYQLFTQTENSNYWGKNIICEDIMKYIFIITKYLFKILQMDKKTEPGFSYFYIFSKLLFIIIILSIISIVSIIMFNKKLD